MAAVVRCGSKIGFFMIIAVRLFSQVKREQSADGVSRDGVHQ